MPELTRRESGVPSSERDASLPLGSRETDVETLVQEELSAEVVALSDAVLALLQHHGYVDGSNLTEDVTLRATEMIFFAAMNCARNIIDVVGEARSGKRRRCL